MRNTLITAEMATEAGIAAHLALNPNLIPPEIAELSDQAAIFASNNVNIFKFTGAADADSEATNIGTSVAVKAIERAIEIDERRKRDANEADADVIAARGQTIRENLAELQQVTYSDGQFHMFGMDIDEEDMDAEIAESAGELDAQAEKYGWDSATKNQMAILYSQWENATGKEKAQLFDRMRETGGEQWAKDRAHEANERQASRPHNAVTSDERADAHASQMAPSEEWVDRQESFAENIGYDAAESTDFGERAASVGNGNSVVSSSGLADSFAAGFSAAPDFNGQAVGNIGLAQAEPMQPTATASTSTLSLS